MYIPKYSEVNDHKLVIETMTKYSFATVITSHDGSLNANHYPFLVDATSEQVLLYTHLARSNPQYTELVESKKCLVVFQGPHKYMSPTYYVNPLNVPTWNYVAVHAQCSIEAIESPKEIDALLHQTVQHFEKINNTEWTYDLPVEFRDRLLSAIVGFKMTVTNLEAKFKLSQNRKKEDYDAVISALSQQPDEMTQQMLSYMKRKISD